MEETRYEPKQAGEEAITAQVQLWEHIPGFINSAVLRCMVQLDLPGIIHGHGGFMALDELAATLPFPSVNKDCLDRILRYLVHLKLLCIEEENNGQRKYGLTPSSKLLVGSQEKSLAPMVMFMLRPDSVQIMQHLSESLESPTSLLQRYLGAASEKEKWRWAEAKTETYDEFLKMMMAQTGMVVEEIVKVMDKSHMLDGMGMLIDVGGSTGQVAGAIAKAFPHVKCSVLELAHVADSITESPPAVTIVKGDMFESIPKSDVVFMKSILHSWNDEDCIKILRNCKEAIPAEGGKVILAEIVLDTNATDGLVGARLGLEMMMFPIGGKERTREEWNKLIISAGFSHCKITPMEAMESIIELSLELFLLYMYLNSVIVRK